MRSKALIVVAAVLGLVGFAIAARLADDEASARPSPRRDPAPVEVAAVMRAPIELRRTFSGTIEAKSRFVVAAHVSGRVERLLVDLADEVTRGQVVAELNDAEQSQGVSEAAAELAVARANVSDAESGLVLATRELERLRGLRASGVVSDSDLDSAEARHVAGATRVKVARARVKRAQATLARSRIRSSYTKVAAVWADGDDRRVVAERHVAEGDSVAPGSPLMTVVDLEPLNAVVYVTEKEYAQVRPGQTARVTTDAFPGRSFSAQIGRIAPVFQKSSRQARMELEVPNREHLLKPGMFIRAEVVLERVKDATIVPFSALTVRKGRNGLFVLDEVGKHVAWRAVRVGIRQGGRVQVEGEGVSGRVVTLGQQLIDDGSEIQIAEAGPATGADGQP
ncbi:MAG: efflux RND transporter periplasmic adaptor subunit [Proteobacteria bacterium]|nr:efflux RND transporter periplasmic adaptor subunit [Pseudomonadota bacterium]